jgi:hypothetical protein
MRGQCEPMVALDVNIDAFIMHVKKRILDKVYLKGPRITGDIPT